MNQTNWNEEKIAQLTKKIPELEIAEQKLKEAIDFITDMDKKREHYLVKKQEIQFQNNENRIEK